MHYTIIPLPQTHVHGYSSPGSHPKTAREYSCNELGVTTNSGSGLALQHGLLGRYAVIGIVTTNSGSGLALQPYTSGGTATPVASQRTRGQVLHYNVTPLPHAHVHDYLSSGSHPKTVMGCTRFSMLRSPSSTFCVLEISTLVRRSLMRDGSVAANLVALADVYLRAAMFRKRPALSAAALSPPSQHASGIPLLRASSR